MHYSFFQTETIKKLDQSLSKQVNNLPPGFLYWILIVGIVVGFVIFIIYWSVRIWRIWKGPGSDLIQKYKNNFEQANIDSKQKSLIMTLIDQVNKEIPSLIRQEFMNNPLKQIEYARNIMDMIIEQIPLCLKSMKNINHRCAIFIIDEKDHEMLKIFEGCGYSIEGKEKLRLNINESVAGKVFTSGEYKYIEDVTKDKLFKPNPKSTKKYYSLLCVPIVVNGSTIAVLSIDGSEKACFNEDDINYFKMFANQIAVIFSLIGYNNKIKEVISYEKIENIG